MSTVETLHSVLQEQGYRPSPADGNTIHFRYYGQPCSLHLQIAGAQVIAELACPLPRPAPTMQAAQLFSRQHPLALLGDQHGHALLSITSLLSERDVASQTGTMLTLLDAYSAAVMFGDVPVDAPLTALPVTPVVAAPALPVTPEVAVPAPAVPDAEPQPASPGPVVTSSSAGERVPPGWEEYWPLMNERYYPLAQALARLGVPVPDDMQVDMLQGHQVKGTAIMQWGAPPAAVVICEPGQMVPEGYLGGTWLRHFTVDQVAASIQHNLRKVGRL